MFGAIFLAFQAVVLYAQVQSDRNRVSQALTLALQASTAQGAKIAGNNVIWTTPAAQGAAVQSLSAFLPLTLSGLTPHGATFQPTASAPPDWTGTLTLGEFQTGRHAGSVSLFGRRQTAAGPYVAAAVSVPVTERFFGVPLNFTLQVGKVMQVFGYNGHQFTEYP